MDRVSEDELAGRVAAALRSREPGPEVMAQVVERVSGRLSEAEVPVRQERAVGRRAGKLVLVGAVSSSLALAGAGAAAAANPYSGFAAAVEGVVRAVGVEWSAMPAGYTREQYEAFWDAGFTPEDVEALEDLWQTDVTATKARAGQMILDGDPLPVSPGSTVPVRGVDDAAFDAFWDAGYTFEDAERLAELWQVEVAESKVRAGQMVLDGQAPPVP
ncbi:hypothetical protein [Sanguibacter suaedae]|uniref:Uncharacterized protein n=1 Tax=Sanguibacter suaedae TaxID=2795737 RepID=A0A934MA59_9MICO|nr:hypothetical protein [Sanguibacter suaedae]MBI9115408.1 hypothetical protein [Sanguibacter suaedae]